MFTGLFRGALPVVAAALSLADGTVLAVESQPFTMTLRRTVYDPAGNVHRAESVILARRSDGSFVSVRSFPRPDGTGTAEQRYVTDLRAGEEFAVDGLTSSLTTLPLPPNVVEVHRRPRQCAADPNSLRQSILGYEAVRILKEHGGPGDIIRIEEWLAPALNCAALKTAVFQGRSGAELRLVNLREALQLTTGEPAGSLFAKPPGYVERSPAERTSEYHRLYPETAASCPACIRGSDADDMYQRRQTAPE